jgi:hypothetical protein
MSALRRSFIGMNERTLIDSVLRALKLDICRTKEEWSINGVKYYLHSTTSESFGFSQKFLSSCSMLPAKCGTLKAFGYTLAVSKT